MYCLTSTKTLSIMTKRIFNFLMIVLSVSVLFTSCKDDTSDMASFTLNIDGLEDLGADYAYEGWIMVDGTPKTTGVFDVSSSGSLSKTSFEVGAEDLENASKFILTIEPAVDSDPNPSSVHILAGDFSGNSANLTIADPAALGDDFTGAAGEYILATPSDGEMNNENSGLWFLSLATGSPTTGLTLPTLPEGWIYEGWAVIDGTPVSTGTFTTVDAVDNAAPFSGALGTPGFPGEDFLTNAPTGLTFPTDLAGGTAVISIEPVPDNSPSPFVLKPLASGIATDAVDHVTYSIGQNLVFPTGSVTR